MRSLRSKASYGKTAMTLTFSGFKIPLLHALLTTGLGQECREGALPVELSGCLTRIEQGSCTVTSMNCRPFSQLPRGCELPAFLNDRPRFMIARSESGEEALTSASLQMKNKFASVA